MNTVAKKTSNTQVNQYTYHTQHLIFTLTSVHSLPTQLIPSSHPAQLLVLLLQLGLQLPQTLLDVAMAFLRLQDTPALVCEATELNQTPFKICAVYHFNIEILSLTQ